jgi:acyl-CoA synthetase (AMP-forming)/AMP-acid ligase II
VKLLRDLVTDVAGHYPDRVALWSDGGDELTFAQWDAQSNALARALVERGVHPRDRIALLVGNDEALLYRVGYIAILKAGAVAVPINPRVAARELEHMVHDAVPCAVIAGANERERLVGLDIATVVAPGAIHPDEIDADAARQGDTGAFAIAVEPDDLCDILYTSGTTGLPKGVAVTNRSVARALRPAPFADPLQLLHAVPVATFMATHGIQAICLQYGVTERIVTTFDAKHFAELIAWWRPDWLTLVPAHALLLMESGVLEHLDGTKTSVVMYGGAPMPHPGVVALAKAFPNATLVNGYGLTEGGTTVVAMPPGEAIRRPGALGRPFDADSVRIVDDQGVDVPAGAQGEVVIKVPKGERRYYNNDAATEEAWRGEWLFTGDLGRFDEDGFLHLVDRKKDVIIRGGYNISSLEVEMALQEHPEIIEAAVVGIDHSVLGQDVAAVLRTRTGGALDKAELQAFLSYRLSDYKHPRRIEILAEFLPRTPAGKVDKRALRELFC